MDIAALATSMSQMQIMQQASLKVTEMAMDTAEVKANGILRLMDELPSSGLGDVTPNLGKHIDVSV